MRRIVPFSACLFAGAVLFVSPAAEQRLRYRPRMPGGLQQGLALDDSLQLARRGGGGGFRGGGGGSVAAVVVSVVAASAAAAVRSAVAGQWRTGLRLPWRRPGWGGGRISRRPVSGAQAWRGRPTRTAVRAPGAAGLSTAARASGAAGPTIAVRVHGAAGPTSTAVGGDAAGTARAIGRRPTTTAAAPWCAGGCGHLTAGASGGSGAATTDKPC